MPSTLNATAGSPNADSYITADDAAAYHAARGNDAWLDGDDTAWDQALRRARAWLDGRYRGYWLGEITYRGDTSSPPAQALAWPRCGVIDDEGRLIDKTTVPLAVQYAQAEAALRELANPGSLTPDLDRETLIERVGPISVQYVPGGEERTELTIIGDLLDGLLIGEGSTTVSFLNRA